jgi:alkenylglycerophosphocholine hydrolase
LIAASLAAAILFLAGGPGFSWIHLIAKLVPVTALLIWLAPPRGRYQALIFVGLLLSLAGDAFLALPGDMFMPGLIAFLCAHLCYIAAFLGERRELMILRGVPYLLWVGGLYLYLLPHLGERAVPVGVYCLVIICMMWRAAAFGQLAAVIGATLFGVSDSILALERFDEGVPYGAALLILAYWAGQTGITLSTKRE